MKRKINYFKRWNENGYLYDQTVNISKQELKDINKHLEDYSTEELEKISVALRRFVKPVYIEKDMIVFTSLVVRDIIAKFLNLELKNRNTCFKVN